MAYILKLLWIAALLHLGLAANQYHLAQNNFKILCYHNVVDKITDPKIMNITTDQLIAHFKWLKTNNYHVISLDDIIKAQKGEKQLPENAVLLTFDDGYVSFYTRIYPLLKLYNYPAVYALVGKWQETPPDQTFLYGNAKKPRKMLLSWEEIKEMMDSGLIEFASHTYDSHHGILGNPQGNMQPAITTVKYDPDTRSYESTRAYIQRIENDLKKSSDIIYQHTGVRPRAIAWPYGAYNGIAQAIAKKYGMFIALTLDDGINTPKDLQALKRILINNNPKFEEFYWNMENETPPQISPEHSIFVNIDEIYDPNPKKTNDNLGLLIEKIRKFKISSIVLNPCSDIDHDGLVDMLYFPNNILPMRADLLNRVAWQLKARAPIEDVYIQMPLYTYERKNKALSLHQPKDQKAIRDIYYNMSKYSFFKGLLFDNSNDPENLDIENVIEFTHELYKSTRFFSYKFKTGLMLDAAKLMQPENQTLQKILPHYKYIYLNTKNLLCNPQNSQKTLSLLVQKIKLYPAALQKTLVLLNQTKEDNKVLVTQMEALKLLQVIHVGYRPENFIRTIHNNQNLIKLFSLRESIFE